MFITSITAALFIATVSCHTPMNGSEVFVTYAGHSEAGTPVHQQKPQEITDHADDKAKVDNDKAKVDSDIGVRAADEVVFIPNEKPVVRNEDLNSDNEAKDLFARVQSTENINLATDGLTFSLPLDQTLVLNAQRENKNNEMSWDLKEIVRGEAPNKDVLFIMGKNYENNEDPQQKQEDKRKKEKVTEDEIKDTASAKLNCSHLDCDVVQVPVCGGKLEQKRWKYRLFLNECFFRKVNCGFRNRLNRYKLVKIEKCKDSAAVYSEKPFVFKPAALMVTTRPSSVQNKNDTRRSFASRRAMNMGSNGQFCSHPCPVSCTEEYDPQCASSATGQKRVFLNHCKLDQNSCLYRVVWHRRPLSWCVGGKMADMRENRGFIAWMQRNGLVDRKGRLSLN